jgi:hypothetical protein
MPTGGRDDRDRDGPEEHDADGAGSGPSFSEEELQRLLADFQREHPGVLDDPGVLDEDHFPTAPVPAAPRHRGASRLTALALVLVLAAGVLISPIPGWVVQLADTLVGAPAPPGTAVGAPEGRAPTPGPDGRLAPAVPVGGAPPPGDFAFLDSQVDGDPVTFDPCRPIHYVVRDREGAGDRGLAAVQEAVARVSEATGLVFVFDGLTDEAPTERRAPTLPRYGSGPAPVLIAWSDPEEMPRLAGDTAGFGGPIWVRGADGRLTYVSGRVVLDTPDLAPDLGVLGRRGAVEAVVVHELGHVIGADHPAAADQLMSAENVGQTRLADGDRYAFALLGQGPCSSAP